MTTNTALLGLIIGALPSISDKEATSKKLVTPTTIRILLFKSGEYTIFLKVSRARFLSQDYPQLPDQYTRLVFVFNIPAFHITLTTGGHCLQSYE